MTPDTEPSAEEVTYWLDRFNNAPAATIIEKANA